MRWAEWVVDMLAQGAAAEKRALEAEAQALAAAEEAAGIHP